MADSFDPYHVWLGIAPDSQPPTHYRLLGIELFEQNDDVIDAAANRQSIALKEFGVLEHATLSQKLLDEVAAARICLLNKTQRKAYDASLRKQMAKNGVPLPESPLSATAKPGYHLWLGITPPLQPPTHYRLLGLDPFESTPEVIEAGAQRQSRYLREVAVGRQRRLSQELLNEVAAAQRCLLDPEKKNAYDKQLRRRADPATKAETAANPMKPQSKATDDGSSGKDPTTEDAALSFPVLKEPVGEREVASQTTAPELHGNARRRLSVAIAGASAAVLFLGVGLLFWSSDSEPVAAHQTTSTAAKDSVAQQTNVSTAASGITDESLPSDPSLLAHWTFDKSHRAWTISTVSPLVLALHGQPEFTAGPLEQAVKLDGKDEFLELPTRVLTPGTGTIAFWVRWDDEAGIRETTPLLTAGPTGPRYGLWLSKNGVLSGAIGSSRHTLNTKAMLVPGQWYHLALTWQKDGRASLLCNGEKVGGVENASPLAVPKKLSMGADAQYSGEGKHTGKKGTSKSLPARVSFDDVRCFSRALPPEELAELAAATSVKLEPPGVYSATPASSLVASTKPPETSSTSPNKQKSNRDNSRKSKPAAPTPPPMRKVNLPGGVNTVQSNVWENVANTRRISKVAASVRQSRPDVKRTLQNLSAGKKDHVSGRTFQRVRGVLIPPVDGLYQFHVKIVDRGQFLLSDGLMMKGKKQVKDGNKVKLSGSQLYFFEVLQADKNGKGNFSIGWTLPNGVKEQPIPGGRLMWTPYLTSFAPLSVSRLQSSKTLTVKTLQDGCLIRVSGDARTQSTITAEFQTDLTAYSAFQLTAVFNEKLMTFGPGLGLSGMFSLNEMTLEYQEPDSTTFVPVPLDAPIAGHGNPAALVDGNMSTTWTVRGRNKQSTSIILVPKTPLIVKPRTRLRLTLNQETPLGLFRFSGTAADAAEKVARMRREIEETDPNHR